MDSSHRNGQKNGASNRSARTPAPSGEKAGEPGARSAGRFPARRGCRPTWGGSASPVRGAPAARSSAERRLRRRKGLRACLRHGGVFGRQPRTRYHTVARATASGGSGLCCGDQGGVAHAPAERSRSSRIAGSGRPTTPMPASASWWSEYSAIDPMPTLEEAGPPQGDSGRRAGRVRPGALLRLGERGAPLRGAPGRGAPDGRDRAEGGGRPGPTRPGSTRTAPSAGYRVVAAGSAGGPELAARRMIRRTGDAGPGPGSAGPRRGRRERRWRVSAPLGYRLVERRRRSTDRNAGR